MRISDWSSEVCSSDLKAARLWQSLASGELADLPGIAERRATIDRAVDYDARFAQALHGRPVVLGFFFKPRLGDGEPAMTGSLCAPLISAQDAKQIGRASCRERVCQYV